MITHFVIETDLSYKTVQKIYWFQRPECTKPGFYEHVTKLSVFFHRRAKDRIRYNVTENRQFAVHHLDEVEFYDYQIKTAREHSEEYNCSDIIDFFEKIGFDYKNKMYLSGDRIKKWDNKKLKFV